MTERLTWFELSALKPGAVVAFGVELHTRVRTDMRVIPVGTIATIDENGLNEIWCSMIVRIVDEPLSSSLRYYQPEHNNCVIISDTPDAGGYGEDADPRWQEPSPFMLHNSCPVECI